VFADDTTGRGQGTLDLGALHHVKTILRSCRIYVLVSLESDNCPDNSEKIYQLSPSKNNIRDIASPVDKCCVVVFDDRNLCKPLSVCG